MTSPSDTGRAPTAVELPSPSAGHGGTSHYGSLFWTGVGIGWLAIAFGVWSLLSRRGATHPPEVAVWVVGLALAHDLVLAPVALLAAWFLRRVAPLVARGLAVGALAISTFVALYAFPLVRRFGAQADNPSFLPRDAGAGLAIVLALVWGVTALMLAKRLRVRRTRGEGSR